jgi:hypothetical protein
MPFVFLWETKVIWCPSGLSFCPRRSSDIWHLVGSLAYQNSWETSKKSLNYLYLLMIPFRLLGGLDEIWVIAWGLIWGSPIILFTLDHFKSMLIQYADLSAKILLAADFVIRCIRWSTFLIWLKSYRTVWTCDVPMRRTGLVLCQFRSIPNVWEQNIAVWKPLVLWNCWDLSSRTVHTGELALVCHWSMGLVYLDFNKLTCFFFLLLFYFIGEKYLLFKVFFIWKYIKIIFFIFKKLFM